MACRILKDTFGRNPFVIVSFVMDLIHKMFPIVRFHASK